jgi:DNA helicase-2/ATP-dependent DNA helicase PcrA
MASAGSLAVRFFADLHIHSRFSRATSRDGTLSELSRWARRKGLAVIGTGDFTHPQWLGELQSELSPTGDGFLRLRPRLEKQLGNDPLTPAAPPTRFVLQAEIATIYKSGGRTRKVHHLILCPDLASVRRINRRLARIGNLASDGRPILGLDSRDLLETVLTASEDAILIPAHIWTPWFSVLGAQSGFDSIEDCYRDLSRYVFALETGLSSDPAMNRRVSSLDRFRLVSSSDAHSPSKLGREACVFEGPCDYASIRQALETGRGFAGTVEFFPEEGKYHLDGHRLCGVCLTPKATRQAQGLCPRCRKPLTVGVMHRIEDLADRPPATPGPLRPPFRSVVPLPEILSEVLGCGASSQRVGAAYARLLKETGPELTILLDAPLDLIEPRGPPRLTEAIHRMRKGDVERTAGYDGQFGTVRTLSR